MLSISNPVSNPLWWLGKDREQREGGREGGTVRNERDNLREMLKTSSLRGHGLLRSEIFLLPVLWWGWWQLWMGLLFLTLYNPPRQICWNRIVLFGDREIEF